MSTISLFHIAQLSQECGLACLGVTGVAPLQQAGRLLRSWQVAEFAGEMGYMQRPVELLSEPLRLLPDAKSIVVFAVNYSRRSRPPLPEGHGKIARYAWGRDYHRVLKKRLAKLVRKFESELSREVNYRVFSDAVPLLERELARKAGLGFQGKNTMLIRPKVGSFFFLAEVLWDLEISGSLQVVEDTCGACVRCIDACPTDAIVAPHQLDARKCISYLTIEKRGRLEEWERRALGSWLFGCDICQDVCPFNHTVLKRECAADLVDFEEEQGCGPSVALDELLHIRDQEDFMERYKGTPLMRAGREGLLRNAAVVAANTGAKFLRPLLKDVVRDDCSDIVKEHAEWAIKELS